MLDFISRFFSFSPEDGLRQKQREALVDILVWTMYIDKYLALSEKEDIEREMASMTWHSVTSIEQYYDESVTRARDVLSRPAKAAAYLEDIKSRLGDEATRGSALDACRQLANADGKIVPTEEAFLDSLRKALGPDQA